MTVQDEVSPNEPPEVDAAEQERRQAAAAGIRTFLTEVVAVADVHPHLRRITFGGGDLTSFVPKSPDQFMYVLLPPPGTKLSIKF